MFVRILAPLAALATILATPALAAAPVGGRWVTPDRDSIIEIGRCGATVCGRVARLLKPVQGGPATDRNNPDAALRRRPLVGLPILFDFTDAGDEWRGRIYDPRAGKTYRSTLVLASSDVLRVKGCIAIFCRTQEWRRLR